LKIGIGSAFHTREATMKLQLELQDSYRVEVSGWDATDSFFVEKTILDWISAEKKEISLRAPLLEGSVVFLRLLQPVSNETSFPLAYQAIDVTPQDAQGRVRVSLANLRPRAPYKETAFAQSTVSSHLS
jgi:hypothetical protein